MPDTNTRWLIGTALVVLGFMHVQHAEIRDEIRAVRADLSADIAGVRAESRAEHAEIRAEFRAALAEVREDLRRLDDRLRAVEVTLGKVDQRLEALERLHEAPAAGQ